MINKIKFSIKVLFSNFFKTKPYKLNFNLTNKCNSNCKTCSIWKKKSNDELNTKQIKKFFEKNNKFYWIDLFGGEILLREDIFEIMNIIIRNSKNLYLLHFPTNGTFPEKTYKLVRKIKNEFKGRIVVSISIDGPKKLHNKIRKEGSYEKAVKTYRLLKKINKKDTFISHTISKYNQNKLNETISSLKKDILDLNQKNIHINFAQTSSYYNNEKSEKEIKINSKFMIQEINNSIKERKEHISAYNILELIYLKNLKQYLKDKNKLKRDTPLNQTITMYPNGDLYGCLFQKEYISNIKDFNYDLKKFYKTDSFKKEKRKLKKCNDCFSSCHAYPEIMSNIKKFTD